MRKLIAVCLLVVPTSLFAWGNAGHQIVARVAFDQLTPAARKEVKNLLGTQSLASIASLPDQWRTKKTAPKNSAKWHFVDIDKAVDHYEAAVDCVDSDCVVDRITMFENVLADKTQTKAKRKEALIYLTHFVGDVSQPMHCVTGKLANGKTDRGGNDVKVSVEGTPGDNLHHVWDGTLIQSQELSIDDYVVAIEGDDILGTFDKDDLAAGTPADWANEGHKFAQAAYVTTGTDLDENYMLAQENVVDEQLLRGGFRLAKILNAVLGGS
jgi:hypothetical protein